MLSIKKGQIIDMLIRDDKIGIFQVVKVEDEHIWGIKLDEYYIKANEERIYHDHVQSTVIERIPIIEPFNIFGFKYDEDTYLESKYLSEVVLEYALWGDEDVLFCDY